MCKALRLSQCKIGGQGRGMPRSRKRKESHVSSATVDAMEWYLASALDLATIDCFLALQDIQLPPRKVQNHVVERQLVGQPAQSASENV